MSISLNKESPMSWGQGAPMFGRKPPIVHIYYSYTFFMHETRLRENKLGGSWVYYYTLRLLRNGLCVAVVWWDIICCGWVYIIYIIYTLKFYGKYCALRLLTVGWVRFIYYIYIIYIILYIQVVRWSVLRVSRSALCALRILELDTLRMAVGEKGWE